MELTQKGLNGRHACYSGTRMHWCLMVCCWLIWFWFDFKLLLLLLRICVPAARVVAADLHFGALVKAGNVQGTRGEWTRQEAPCSRYSTLTPTVSSPRTTGPSCLNSSLPWSIGIVFSFGYSHFIGTKIIFKNICVFLNTAIINIKLQKCCTFVNMYISTTFMYNYPKNV